MAVPGVTIPEVVVALVGHCENLRSRFAVIDMPKEMTKTKDLLNYRDMIDSTYAAMYHPWILSHHSSMKNVGPVRKEMGERTMFNILGPLTNPANASLQLLGVYDKELVEKLAEVLSNLGVKRGMAVCGNAPH